MARDCAPPTRSEWPDTRPSIPAAAAMARRRLERERPVKLNALAAGSTIFGPADPQRLRDGRGTGRPQRLPESLSARTSRRRLTP